jgi:hypothetical protein
LPSSRQSRSSWKKRIEPLCRQSRNELARLRRHQPLGDAAACRVRVRIPRLGRPDAASSGAGDALIVPLADPDRSWWRVGAAFTWMKRPATVIGLSYDVTLANDDQRIGSLTLGLRHRF